MKDSHVESVLRGALSTLPDARSSFRCCVHRANNVSGFNS
jgi:hypothetical protein